jgi:UDP-N-acetylmuramyl pentapeptide phosphotransferase/UDP-N-acetylglucosamine-1-phosphate transferase
MSTKQILLLVGSYVAIITLAIFIITSKSVLFTIMSGIGCIALMFICDEYRKLVWENDMLKQKIPTKNLGKKA